MGQLSRLLDPSSPPGIIPRLLSEPFSPDNLGVQIHVMRLMQQLFDTPRDILSSLLLPQSNSKTIIDAAPIHPTPAPGGSSTSFYVRHHLVEASRMYHASHADPSSACAEVCGLHLRLLHSLIRSGIPEVLSAACGARVLDLLLGELQGLHEAAVEAAEAEAAATDSAVARTGDGEDDDDGDNATLLSQGGGGTGAAPELAPPAGGHGPLKPFSGKFEFCYDLNEDLERILQLEDQLGG